MFIFLYSLGFFTLKPLVTIRLDPETDLPPPILGESNATCLQIPKRTEWYFLTVHYSTVSFRSVQFDVSIQTSNCSSPSMFMSVNEGKTKWKKCDENNSKTESGLMCSFIRPGYEENIKASCNLYKNYVFTYSQM